MKTIWSLKTVAKILGFDLNLLKEVAAVVESRLHAPFEKRVGKKVRQIDNPIGVLKSVQYRILRRILEKHPMPGYLHGALKGRSPATNASAHLGQECVVRIDIRNFFPSVTDRQVYEVWRTLGFGKSAAGLLTRLTTFRRHLPQGAPTSSFLANLVLLGADERIRELIRPFDIKYTRYVDDLNFSGNCPQKIIDDVISTLRSAGFSVARDKILIAHRGALREVTGYAVNSKSSLSIAQRKRERIRAAIGELRYLPALEAVKQKRSIQGRIDHIKRHHPGAANALESLLARYPSIHP